MPPRQFSRFALSDAVPSNVDEDLLILAERVPFRFQSFNDTIEHSVLDGDSLYTIAAHYYSDLDRPAGLFWILADFQPDPIHDPTLALDRPVIYVPSVRVVISEIFSERRRGL